MIETAFIFLIIMANLFIIQHMVTRNILIALLPIFLILIINFASAIEVNFDYKDGVEIDEEFELEITSDSSDKIYDVKIFVQDAEGKIISEIDNSGWKNPFYYIKSSYPEKSKYKIRIVEYLDDTEICLRLRESTKSNFDEKCQDIEIIKGDYIEDNPSEKFDDVDESDLTSANQSTLLLEKPNEDKIILNKKNKNKK